MALSPSGDTDSERLLDRGLRRALALSVLGVVCLLQLGLSAQSVILPVAKQAWQYREMPSVQRGVAAAFGSDFADFIQFIDSTVPPDARLVLPRPAEDSVLGSVALMQYMLFPRELVNCPSGLADEERDCILGLGGSNTYILATGDFPPRDAAATLKTFVSFSGKQGVYIPRP